MDVNFMIMYDGTSVLKTYLQNGKLGIKETDFYMIMYDSNSRPDGAKVKPQLIQNKDRNELF